MYHEMDNQNWNDDSPADNQNWNDDSPAQDQENHDEQPQISSASQSQWQQKSWLNVKATTWLKCIIITAVLTTAAFIAPKLTSADNQQQNSSNSAVEAEQDWYYEDFLEDYGCEDYSYDDYSCEEHGCEY